METKSALCLLCLFSCVDMDGAQDFASELERVLPYVDAEGRPSPSRFGTAPPRDFNVTHWSGDSDGRVKARSDAGTQSVVLWFGEGAPARKILTQSQGIERLYAAVRVESYRGPFYDFGDDLAVTHMRAAERIESAITVCPQMTMLIEAVSYADRPTRARLMGRGYLEALGSFPCLVDQVSLQRALGSMAPVAPSSWVPLPVPPARAKVGESWGEYVGRVAGHF
ncbi:MAG: hypothetical protein AAFQ82_06540 [Myxococcota bacterium]